MNIDKTGGTAFPHEFKFGDGIAHRDSGMTLRDYFAAKAMLGFICEPVDGVLKEAVFLELGDETCSAIADAAYALADAMLKARAA